LKYSFFLLLIILVIASCSKDNRWDCLKRTGDISFKTENLQAFSILTLEDQFQVEIILDTIDKIIIEGGKNLLPLISCNVNEGNLSLKNNIRCRWARDYDKQKIKVKLYTRNLTGIYIKDKCEITSESVICSNNFFIEVMQNIVASANLKLQVSSFNFMQHSGTGKYVFIGSAENAYFFIKGTGYIYAENLQSDYVHVVNKSTGNVYVNALKKLYVEFTGKGDVYYSGAPPEIVFDPSKSTGHIIPN